MSSHYLFNQQEKELSSIPATIAPPATVASHAMLIPCTIESSLPFQK
jgi:hypothetical protein